MIKKVLFFLIIIMFSFSLTGCSKKVLTNDNVKQVASDYLSYVRSGDYNRAYELESPDRAKNIPKNNLGSYYTVEKDKFEVISNLKDVEPFNNNSNILSVHFDTTKSYDYIINVININNKLYIY